MDEVLRGLVILGLAWLAWLGVYLWARSVRESLSRIADALEERES